MKNKRFLRVILLIPFIVSGFILSSQNIPDFRVNELCSPDGSEQSSPAIAGNGTGSFVVTWEDNRLGFGDDIFAQIYLNSNTPTGSNFKVNDDSTFSYQYGPEVAVDPNGNFIIVWVDGRGADWNVYAQRFLADGTPAGQNFRVNNDDGTEDQVLPTISFDDVGNFVIIWADERNSNWDIYGQLYSNSGIEIGTNFMINDDLSDAIQYWPSCTRHADGSFIVAWADQRNGNYDIYYQRFTNDGTAIGSNSKASDDAGVAIQFLPELTILQNGNFVITWTDERNNNRDIYAQRFLNDGTPAGQNFLVNDDNTNNGQQTSYIAADSAGNFTICWEDSSNTFNDIYARCYNNEGIAIDESFMVNDDTLNAYQYYSGITADLGGNFTIAWEDYRLGNRGDIFLQHFDDEGTPVLTNQKVNDDFGSENQGTPSVAALGIDKFLIVWVDNRYEEGDIFAQWFEGNGNFIGANFKVTDETGYIAQYEPSVAADTAGNSMIVWTDFRSGYPSNIYAQVYAPDGSVVGNNFQVDNAGAYMHYSPVVAASPNGGFVVTWWDTNDGGSDTENLKVPENFPFNSANHPAGLQFSDADVWAQRFSAEGEAIGDNFRVNDVYDDYYHYYPDVAVDNEGRFVIAWCDERDGEDAVYFQRYSAEGTPIGVNTKVESLPSGVFQRSPSVAVDANGGFVISWMDYQPSLTRILAQRFSSQGIPEGDILEVSDGVENTYSYSPEVAAGETGNFTICWYYHNSGVYNVLARRYDGSGIPVGEIYGLASSENSYQIFPEVTMQNNRIFATWQDNRGGQTGFDIWANVYEWDSWVGTGSEPFTEKSTGEPVLRIFPNPVKNLATINFTLKLPGSATLQIIDGLGRIAKTFPLGSFTQGKHEITFETPGLPKGLFVCTLMVYGEVIGRAKVVIEN